MIFLPAAKRAVFNAWVLVSVGRLNWRLSGLPLFPYVRSSSCSFFQARRPC